MKTNELIDYIENHELLNVIHPTYEDKDLIYLCPKYDELAKPIKEIKRKLGDAAVYVEFEFNERTDEILVHQADDIDLFPDEMGTCWWDDEDDDILHMTGFAVDIRNADDYDDIIYNVEKAYFENEDERENVIL